MNQEQSNVKIPISTNRTRVHLAVYRDDISVTRFFDIFCISQRRCIITAWQVEIAETPTHIVRAPYAYCLVRIRTSPLIHEPVNYASRCTQAQRRDSRLVCRRHISIHIWDYVFVGAQFDKLRHNDVTENVIIEYGTKKRDDCCRTKCNGS